jgi:hypothetical protein
MVASVINDPLVSGASPATQTLVYWINDGGTVNLGWRKVDGIDFSGSYDWDMGNLGAFNIGDVFTYYLHDITFSGPGTVPVDLFHSTISPVGTMQQVGVATMPRVHSRARLGWSNGPWNVTGFVNYDAHWFDKTTPVPPNVNNQCVADGVTPGGTLPCVINNYTNELPPWYTFDLSFGYDTGEDPGNDYLKHIGLNFVVQNLANKHAPFEYGFSSAARGFTGFDRLRSDEGRVFSVLMTKTW